MKKFLTICFLVSLLFFVPARAADFLFDYNTLELNQNNEMKINLFVKADNHRLNAISGKLEIPQNILIKEIIDSSSGINLWIEKPSLTNNEITFAGIVPGGFDGQINIFSLIIEGKHEGEGSLLLSDAEALINDGLGTADNVNYYPLTINVLPAGDEVIKITAIEDSEPPEIIWFEIIKDKSLFNKKYTAIFLAEDKQSGIDYYEILEQRQYNFFGIKYCHGKWQKAESPYLLNDQKLKSYITLKAVDKAGFQKMSDIKPRFSIKWYENIVFWGIILITLICGVIFCIYVKRRVKK
jgi:hypothetical protein